MQKWNILMHRAQRADEKNRVICRVIIFTPPVMIIKMSKIAHCFIYCWWQQNISHSLGKISKCIWKIFFSFFGKCYGLLGSELPLASCQALKIWGFTIFFSCISFFNLLSSIFTPKLINHAISFQVQLNLFPNCG